MSEHNGDTPAQAIVPRTPRTITERIIEQALHEIRTSVCRNLESDLSGDSIIDGVEIHPHIEINRAFPIDENNFSLLREVLPSNQSSRYVNTDPTHNRTRRRITVPPELRPWLSYDGLDGHQETLNPLFDWQNMASQPGTPEMNGDLSTDAHGARHPAGSHDQSRSSRDTATMLDEILKSILALQTRLTHVELAQYDGNEHRAREREPLDITYGRTIEDVRNSRGPVTTYLRLKEARNMIPEIDGSSQSKLKEFLSACNYVIRSINPAEERMLLEAILCTKLKGKAMLDFETRDIRSFSQLKKELETCYLSKKSTAHLQLEFNALKQKPSEHARAYGLRVDNLAMELYESLIEGEEHTAEQKRGILQTIQKQALQNFQFGLHEDIKTLVRSQHYSTLQEAIAGAGVEERVKGPISGSTRNKYENSPNTRNKMIQCHKCNKMGHYGKDCRTSRYANKFTFPKADKANGVNTVDKYCTYCKKAGHRKEECWSLKGRGKEKVQQPKSDNYRKKTVNNTIKARRNRDSDKSDESTASSSEDEKESRSRKRRSRAASEHQVAQVTTKTNKNSGLDLVTLPIAEAKKGNVSFLVDSGATITLIKVGQLKGDTPIFEEDLTITGVTGHKIDTLGSIKVSVNVGRHRIKQKMYVVKDNFPIDYDGILGIDFLKKQKARCDHGKEQLRIGKITFKLYPYQKITLKPRSETVIRAMTKQNMIGIVKAEETKPGVFIGHCLVEPKDYTCPISVINTTESPVELSTPYVKIEKLAEINNNTLVLQIKEGENRQLRRENIHAELRTTHLNKEEKKALTQICENYSDIFQLKEDPLTNTLTVAHEIVTRADSAPVNVRPYRLPEKHRAEVNRQVKEMLEKQIIRPSTSQWNAPILVVPKKIDASGKQKLRIVVDFRKLNDLTIGDSFPLPNITDILDQLGNAKYFSTLDLASGYHQIPMDEKHKNKTAFSTPYGHYEFNRMPFGLKNAPATFQRLMNSVLTGIQGIRCLVYLDDIVIYGASLKEHNQRLIEVFQRLREHNLKLQPDKCEFLRKEVVYLGHIITENGISPDPSKLEAVMKFPTPKRVKDVQSFIGLAGYYRKFIENFSKLAKPLTKLTKKGEKFSWATEQQNAFDLLKEKLTTAPVLRYPDFTEEFIITTDASDVAIGAVLSQGTVGQDRPVAYASRILNKAERNYNTTEKELLAIVWAVKHFRPYVYGTKFKVVTDHKPLVWLFSVNDPGSRLIRWRLKLEEYDYEIIHKAGKANANADALSRNVLEEINTLDKEGDNDTGRIYTEEEKKKILYEYHNAPLGGHQGITRTLNRIKLQHKWYGMNKDVEEYINKCEQCQKNKLSRKTRMPLIITDTPDKPFEKCALDIVGPLPVTIMGNKYILTFQDGLTKFSKAIPVENQEAATIAKAFVTKIIFEHGTPETVLTDQGTNFTSEMFKNVCKLLKIEKIQTTAYHPESNGALERSHRTLAEYLRHYINAEQTNWDEWLPYAMFTYNTTPHTATGFTPFELMYGYQAEMPTALNKPPKPTYSYDDYAQELRERIRATNQVAREHAKQEKVKAKQQYDKKTTERKFKIGEKVLLYDETVRRGRSKKLDALWIGPYEILEVNGDVNYTIKMGRKKMRVHANRLKTFIEI